MNNEEMFTKLMNHMDNKFDEINDQFNQINKRFDTLDDEIEIIKEAVVEDKEKIQELRSDFSSHTHEIKDIKIVNK